MQKIITFLMFEGKAEEAMNFYISLFDQSSIVNMMKYGPGQNGTEGSVMHATFILNGQTFMCIDSSVKHAFTFTPSVSLYIACETEGEIDKLYNKLSEGGKVLMPLSKYPFSEKYAWVADKFGVAWQLSLIM